MSVENNRFFICIIFIVLDAPGLQTLNFHLHTFRSLSNVHYSFSSERMDIQTLLYFLIFVHLANFHYLLIQLHFWR